MSDKSDKPLIQHSKETYGDDFNAHLLEQYKLYVQSADNVSARRIASNRYLLTVSVTLLALYGVDLVGIDQRLVSQIAPGIGLVVSLVWWLIIRSHKHLNRIKFEIINELEQHLPATLFACEWQKLEQGQGRFYIPFTKIEPWVPFMFLGIHAMLYILIIVGVPDCLLDL